MDVIRKSEKDPLQRQRCNCKRCADCLEDARWERIFQAKFADPLYYDRRYTRVSSPLVDI